MMLSQRDEEMRSGFPWFVAAAYALVAAFTLLILTSNASGENEKDTERFVSGDKDQDNILGEGTCPPIQMKVSRGKCDPIVPLPRRRKSLCKPLSDGVRVMPFDSTEVAALAADAAFDINDVLRGDGACLRIVAESAEEEEAAARDKIDTTDGGVLMSRMVEYRNHENRMFHDKLFSGAPCGGSAAKP